MSVLVGGMCSIIMLLGIYIVFTFFVLFYLVLKRQTERPMAPASANFVCHFCYESDTERTNFRIMFYMFYVCKMCMFCIVFNFCKI